MVMDIGGDGASTDFERLNKAEQAAVREYARLQWNVLATKKGMGYVQTTDAEAWQNSLRELIARDPKRIQSIMELLLRDS